MALKALLLRKKIDQKNKELETLRAAAEQLATREKDLEAAVAEAVTDEEHRTCEEAVEAFEQDRTANTSAIADLEAELRELDAELAAEEAAQNTEPAPAAENPEERERGANEMIIPEKRNRFGVTDEMVRREDVASFLTQVRTAAKNKRDISGAEYTIPTVMMGIIRENVMDYSKLYRHCFVRRINGDGKLTVMGTVPEAVWTACCGILNEIDLVFSQVQVDCNKVAAFIPVCNSTLDDSDINLAGEILQALLISLGIALDKAILYGPGAGAPMGVYTRLAQTSKPAGYPESAPAWIDLHETNLLTIANTVTGIDLFKTIMLDSAAISGKYSRGEIVWAMNDTTYKFLKAQGMSVNAAGAIVSAVEGEMPGVGGILEVLDFMPDYNIIAGHFDLYLLADRMGMRVESSELTKFVEDETIFRAKGRYDGLPVIAKAFMGLAINSASFSAPSFKVDKANTVEYLLLNTSALTVQATKTAQLSALPLNAFGKELKGTITWTSSATGKATVDANGKVTGVASGSAVITATCGDATAVCNVTVS